MKDGQINLSYIGTTYPTQKGGTLTVESPSSNRRGKNIIWNVSCSICSKDKELFPSGFFQGNKYQLDQGQVPCGCSTYKYNYRQNKIILSRASLIIVGEIDGKFLIEDIDRNVCYVATKAHAISGFNVEPLIPKREKWVKPIVSQHDITSAYSENEFYNVIKKLDIKLIGKYVKAHSKVKVICSNNHSLDVVPSQLKLSMKCPRCNCRTEKFESGFSNYVESLGFKSSNYSGSKGFFDLTCSYGHKTRKGVRSFKDRPHCSTCTNTQYKSTFLSNAFDLGLELLSDIKKNHKIKSNDKYLFRCNNNHETTKKVQSVLNRTGCIICNEGSGGYRQSLKGYLYVLKHKDSEIYKVGKSNNVPNRIFQLTNATPFDFDVLAIFFNEDGRVAHEVESQIHRENISAGYLGFDGHTEWILGRPSILDNHESKRLYS